MRRSAALCLRPAVLGALAAVSFHLVGADPRSKGMGFDLAELIFERVKEGETK